MAQLSWSLALKVVGGSSMSMSVLREPIEIEAVDHIEVAIKKGVTDKVVEIQPIDKKAIQALVIKSSNYSADPAKLSFKIGDGSDELGLEGPQFFSGGTIAFFENSVLQLKFTKLKFTNKTEEVVNIEIFVARDATPS